MFRLLPLALLLCAPAAAQPAKILFDTDMAGDCDDVGALAVLHALADRGEAEILAVISNRKEKQNASAAAIDAINTYYGRPDIPIGTDKDGAKLGRNGDSPYTPALRDEFPHDALPDDRMPDALDVYRQTLAAQPDNSVVLCSVGALSNLEDLLRSSPDQHSSLSGADLIRRKVRRTLIMGGGFPRTARPETNLLIDPSASVTVANEWPGPIVWQGYEVGAALHNGADLASTPADNPVRRAYELRPYFQYRAIDYGKPAHDLATVLLAARGVESEYWEEFRNGRVVVDSDGHTEWKTDRRADHSWVRIKGHPRRLQAVLEELLTSPPAR